MMKTYAIAGTGVRGLCFAKAMIGPFADVARLVGLYDLNRTRMKAFVDALGTNVPCYSDFAALAHEQRPDVLIICTPDHTHDELIDLAFQHEMDAVCEKPLATSIDKVRRIFHLERRYGRQVQVTFNVRYATYPMALKRALLEHDIGQIYSVHLEWYLDKVHGAEYFRRWHRQRGQSGGLLVHKATHHFDYVNWLLGDHVQSVAAFGSLLYFGHNGPFRGANCRVCDHRHECAFAMDTSNGDESIARMRSMYMAAEHEDGYVRDQCVFGDDIDIHDTMSVIAQYHGGAQLAYSLKAYAPCEGYRMTLTGTTGRIEAQEFFGGMLLRPEYQRETIRVIRGEKRTDLDVRDLALDVDRGDHGGGDRRLYTALFHDDQPDPLNQRARSIDGANSCLVGICANASIEQRRVIDLPALHGSASDHGDRALTAARVR